MKLCYILISTFILASACSENPTRIVEDFNNDWKFQLANDQDASNPDFDDSSWEVLSIPHDWSIVEGYQNVEGTAASTGFVPGGIGWYRKSFSLSPEDADKNIRIAFDGIYNNSSVWINGHLLGTRPNGYISFSYDLSDHLIFDGAENVISVKVDRTAYVDSRWYSGSGIYRKVQLIKTSPLHVAQWGIQISTPKVSKTLADINVRTQLANSGSGTQEDIFLQYTILENSGGIVGQEEVKIPDNSNLLAETILQIEDPKLWSVKNPYLYTLKLQVKQGGKIVDETSEVFGVRTYNFDADSGFSLNGEKMKIKGVNLHHDGGAVGSAVPKDIWKFRIEKLKSIGVNAVRLSHNPHSVELLEVCDELGMLAISEAFDEWDKPKGKSLVYLGDNAAPYEAARAYPEHFNEWAERDLKDLVRRDFNHPSVFMWSIGNEIEWTYPHYSKTFADVNGPNTADGYKKVPIYDTVKIRAALEKNIEGEDSIAIIARKLSSWIKEIDTSRPVNCGAVLPSIGMVSGYGRAVDIFGFNYRASDYDIAHETYPNNIILGTENWGSYGEWKSCIDRDFVAGIFAWTGFAYMGEAGPWPRKGLEISFFDFAGFKTPRGHFFECLWKDTPKVYTVTTPADESEFSYSDQDGWKFTMQLTPPPVWKMLRVWEWYKVYSKWKYDENESIIVQSYTNCEEAELFLNGISLGKQKRSEFSEDNIIKWLVPFQAGELKVVGYDNDEIVTEFLINTPQEFAKISLSANKTKISADGKEVVFITALLLDENDNLVSDLDQKITFELSGAAKNLGVDNGWEKNIQNHKSNSIVSHNGRAILIIQSTDDKGQIMVNAISEGEKSNVIEISSN